MRRRSAAGTGLALTITLIAAACSGPGRLGEARPPAETGSPRPGEQEPAEAPGGGDAADPNAAGVLLREVTLYFTDDSGRLLPETREISSEGSSADQARRVVEALLEGPRGALAPAVPPHCALRALYLTRDGTAYVDLDAAFSRGLRDGSRDALVAVWSITDTLAVNFAQVRAVKILVEGEEVRELGGHLDLSRPLAPDMSLVVGAPPGQGGERAP